MKQPKPNRTERRLVTTLMNKVPVLMLGFLSACGGQPNSAKLSRFSSISGNWQFDMTSSVGMPALTISGDVSSSKNLSSALVHISGSSCFDPLITVPLGGPLSSDGDVQLTSASVAGQVVAIKGKAILPSGLGEPTLLDGAYRVTGGCADGDSGHFYGAQVPPIDTAFNSVFTLSTGQTFGATINVAQDQKPTAAGSFALTGIVSFGTPCFTSGSLNVGTFPAGSFIIGKFVALRIATNNGVVSLGGTVDPHTGEVNGTYSISGGTCDQRGTIFLAPVGLWDYDRSPRSPGN